MKLLQTGIIPEKAIKLAVNDTARDAWGKRIGCHPDRLPLAYGMLSGAMAGLCQVVVTNPMEMVKIQLQLASSRGTANSAISLIRSLGLPGLYRGTAATFMRDIPFSIIFFSSVSLLKDQGPHDKDGKPNLSTVFGSGIMAGAFSAAIVTPMDVVKTRLQIIPLPGEIVYTSMAHCYR